MRAFIAIPLPEEVRAALAALQGELAQSQADVKWVEPSNLHVTLKFLGEIAEEQRQVTETLLRRVAEQEASFTLGVAEVGAFPGVESPRVVWVGLADGKDTVARIAQRIDEEGQSLALPHDERSFSAHVTIGRVRSPRNRQALTQRLRDARLMALAPWRVSTLTLYQSVLSLAGPRYSVLAEAPLAPRE